MADVRIQDLLATTTVADTDLFIVEDNADTKKITKSNLVETLGINGKAPTVHTHSMSQITDYEVGVFTPTVTATSGTFTTVSGTCRYTKIGRMVFIDASIAITTAGTATNSIRFTLPFASGGNSSGVGKEIQATGFQLTVDLGFGATSCVIAKYDGTTIIANGRTIRFSLAYSV